MSSIMNCYEYDYSSTLPYHKPPHLLLLPHLRLSLGGATCLAKKQVHYSNLSGCLYREGSYRVSLSNMAEGPVHKEKSLEQLEKDITCPVCQEHYTDPKVLPCLHYYCKKCILKLALRTASIAPTSPSLAQSVARRPPSPREVWRN